MRGCTLRAGPIRSGSARSKKPAASSRRALLSRVPTQGRIAGCVKLRVRDVTWQKVKEDFDHRDEGETAKNYRNRQQHEITRTASVMAFTILQLPAEKQQKGGERHNAPARRITTT